MSCPVCAGYRYIVSPCQDHGCQIIDIPLDLGMGPRAAPHSGHYDPCRRCNSDGDPYVTYQLCGCETEFEDEILADEFWRDSKAQRAVMEAMRRMALAGGQCRKLVVETGRVVAFNDARFVPARATVLY